MAHPKIEQFFNNYDWPDFEKEEWRGWFGTLENLDSVEIACFSYPEITGWNCLNLDKKECNIQYRDENFMIIKSALYGLLWKIRPM